MNKSIFFLAFIGLIVASCGDKKSEGQEKVELKTFKQKLSYSLGADHARNISESGDRNYPKYDLDQLIDGFKNGLSNENAFDETCKNTLREMFGPQGTEFDASKAKVGSNCIGKLSASFFYSGWKQKRALDKLDMKMVLVGFEHGLRKMDSLVPKIEQGSIIQNFVTDLNKQNGIEMIQAAAKKPNTKSTASGLVLETILEGKGGNPAPGDDVLAHYVLMNSYGDTLQNSFEMVEKYKQPLTPFSLTQVVPGWQEGIPMMKKGGKYRLYLPFHIAYGQQGMFNPQSNRYDIQPYESLVFYIELMNYGKPGSLK